MKTTFAGEVAAFGLPQGPVQTSCVGESEIALLPPPVQRYLRWMGVLDHPRDWSFRLHCLGRFKPAIDAEWRPAESWQYNSALDIARIFHIKLQFYGIPVVGRDIYLHGTGHQAIRPLDLVTMEHDTGPAFTRSKLVAWLNDAVLFAPSMLVSSNTQWRSGGDDEFGLSFTNAGVTVSARVTLDALGSPLEFASDIRSARHADNGGVRRARWATPVERWQVVRGHRIPTRARAVWHLPGGEFAYAELDIRADDVEFNVAPGIVT